jgi:hypothetical protein
MEHEDQEAQKPLLVTAPGRSGDGCASGAASSSSSIAVVVASTAVAVAGSFEFGISVIKPFFLCSVCYSMLQISCLYGIDNQARRQLRPQELVVYSGNWRIVSSWLGRAS